jgi:CubicO group peptidase (beta-lactamase class C family)
MTRDQCGGKKVAIGNHGDGFGFGFGVVTEAARDRGLGNVGTFSWGGFYFTYFWADPQVKLGGVLMTQMYPWGNQELWSDFRRRAYEALGD